MAGRKSFHGRLIQACFQAHLVEANVHEVDAAIEAVASLVASGMDWADVSAVVKEERKKGNPVAELIHSLDLEKNRMTLLLSANLDDASEEDLTKPASRVEVDLSMSALANAGESAAPFNGSLA